MNWLSLIPLLGSIIVGALGDGFNRRPKRKEWKYNLYQVLGHSLQAIEIGVLLMSPFYLSINVVNWFYYLATYALFRASLFNLFYNLASKNHINYIGESNLFDLLMKKVDRPLREYWIPRVLFGGVAIFMFIQQIL